MLSALGALHYAILANEDFSPGPWSVETAAAGTLLSSEDVEKAVIGSLSRRPASKVYEHFLGFKQRALQRLSQDIQDPVMRHDNRTLAAIMLLALMDAIESGDGAWKYHLEGAKKLLKGRQEGDHPDGPATQGLFSWLDDFAIDGILMYVDSKSPLFCCLLSSNPVQYPTDGLYLGPPRLPDATLLHLEHGPGSPQATRRDLLGRLPRLPPRSDLSHPRGSLHGT